MKKVGRKAASILLTLCMLLTMLPVSALAVDTASVSTDFTLEGTSDCIGSGWSWVNSTKTLVLTGGTISEAVNDGFSDYFAFILPDGSTIELNSSSTVSCSNADSLYDIQCKGDLTITGDGTLNVEKVSVGGQLTVAGGATVHSYMIDADSVTVDTGAELNAIVTAFKDTPDLDIIFSSSIYGSITLSTADGNYFSELGADITLMDDAVLTIPADTNLELVDLQGNGVMKVQQGATVIFPASTTMEAIAAMPMELEPGVTLKIAAGEGTDSTPVYTVTFMNESQVYHTAFRQEGNTIARPAEPSKEGDTFGGWYKEDTFVTQWDFTADTVTANTTLYAKWEKETVEPAADVAQIGDEVYKTLQDAVNAVPTDGSLTIVTLIDDITEMTTDQIVTINVNQNIELNMDEHHITVDAGFVGRPIKNYGTLTVTGNGVIDSSASNTGGYGAIDNYGTLTIKNGTYTGSVNADGASIKNRPDCTLIIENGTFNGAVTAVYNEGTTKIYNGLFDCRSCSSCNNGSWGYTIQSHKNISGQSPKLYFYNGTVVGVQGAFSSSAGYTEIRNGSFETVSCEKHSGGTSTFYALYVAGEDEDVKCVVYDGTFKSVYRTAVLIGNDNTNGDGGINANATSEIKGGTFIAPKGVPAITGATNTGNPVISGGTFSSQPDKKYFAAGFKPEQNDNGTWGVVAETTYVAQIGEKNYATLSEALTAVEDGDTIKVLAPATVEMTETYAITGKAITLDLNGQTVTWNTSAKEGITVKDGGLTIQDSGTSGALNFTSTYNSTSNSGIYVYTGGSLTINSGTVTYCHDSKSGRAIYTLGSGAFAMTGGTVKISGATNYALYLNGTASSEITGGRIVFDDQTSASMVYGLCAYGSGAVNITDLEVDGSNVPETKTVYCVYGANNHISGGTYKTNSRSTSYAVSGPSSNTSSISNGTFNGAVKAGIGKITGGLFSVQPSVDYLSEGKIYEKREDGYYHVVNGTYVACMDGVGYTSWDDLFSNVLDNSSSAKIVDVMSDSDMITIPAKKNVTFRSTADYKIGKIVNNGSLRVISQMTDTVIENNGTLSLAHEVGSIVNAENASVTVAYSTSSNAKVTDSIVNSGTLNIASGTYPCDIQNSGTLNITGGTFQRSVTSTGTSNITGGTFSANIKDLCANGYTTRKNREGTWEVVIDDRVAQNGEYWYSSLADALKDVRTGETVTLLKDASLKNEITITDKNITIDTNGHIVTYTGENSYRYAVINLSGTSNVLVTGNGTFTFDSNYVTYNDIGYIFSLAGNSSLTIENGTYHAVITCIQLDESAVAYIKDGIFSTDSVLGLYDGKYWALNRIDNSDTKFYVYGGTFENYDPSNSATEDPANNFCADGYMTTSEVKDGKTYYTVVPAAAEINDTYYATLADAIAAAEDNATITLLADVTEDVVVPEGKNITLDLNGHNISNVADHTITVKIGATLAITGAGTVDNVTHAKAAIWNEGTVTLNGGAYTRSQENGNSSTDAGGNSYYNIVNHGTMTINSGVSVTQDGHFSSMIENGYYNYSSGDASNGYVAGVNAVNPELTINGGTFSGGLNTVKNDDGGKLTINGGTFTNTTQATVLNWNIATIAGGTFKAVDGNCLLNGAYSTEASVQDLGQMTITGGSFTSPEGTACIVNNMKDSLPEISGGTFSEKPDDTYFVEGYAPELNEDGKWEVVKEAFVAEIVGGEKYESLINAVEAATAGHTVKLLANVELQPVAEQDYVLMIDANQSMTLDLNGYKITATLSNAEKFNLINNCGELTITDTSEGKNGSIEVTENGTGEEHTSILCNEESTGEFTLEAGTLKLTGSEGSKKPLRGLYNYYSVMVVNGGAIEVRRLDNTVGTNMDGEHWDVYGIYNYGGSSQTTVNGGKITVENQGRWNTAYGIYGFAGTTSIRGNADTPEITAIAVMDGTYFAYTVSGSITLYGGKYATTKMGEEGWDYNVKIADGYEKRINDDGTVSVVKSPVAQIGKTKYYTLEEAVAAVQSGETIQLLADVEDVPDLYTNNKNMTIALNDHNITFKTACGFVVNGGALNLTGSGTVTASNPTTGYSTIQVNGSATDSPGYSTLTVGENVTLVNTANKFAISVWHTNNAGYGAKVDFAGKIETAAGITISGNVTQVGTNIPEIIIRDTANINSTGTALYGAGLGRWTIEGGYIQSTTTGIEMRAGEMTISEGTTVSGGTDEFVVAPNGNGSTTSNVALAVVQHTTKLPVAVTVEGGTFTGGAALFEQNAQNNDAEAVAKIQLSVTGGTFNGKVYSKNKTDFISGGSFSEEPNKDYLAPYYEATQKTPGEGYWTVDVAANIEAIWIKTDATTEAGMLNDMLSKAKEVEAGTVALLQDVTTDNKVEIFNGVTLDLNGYTLESNYLSSFGQVVDNSDNSSGLLKVDSQNLSLDPENRAIPIYDESVSGYRLAGYKFESLHTNVKDGRVQFWFQLTFENTDMWDLLKNVNSGVTLNADLKVNNETLAKVRFTTEVIKQVTDLLDRGEYKQEQLGFYVYVGGLDAVAGQTLAVTPTLTAPGMISKSGTQLTYAVPAES